MSILSDLGDSVKTDINLFKVTDLLPLWNLAKQSGDPAKLVLTTENVLYQTTEDNLYILLPKLNDYKEIQKAFQNVLQ